MPRGDKSSYTNKQRRQAQHIEEGYEKRGTSPKRAARIAYATVNKQDGGGKKTASGKKASGKTRTTPSSKKRGQATGGARTAKKSSRSRSKRNVH